MWDLFFHVTRADECGLKSEQDLVQTRHVEAESLSAKGKAGVAGNITMHPLQKLGEPYMWDALQTLKLLEVLGSLATHTNGTPSLLRSMP